MKASKVNATVAPQFPNTEKLGDERKARQPELPGLEETE